MRRILLLLVFVLVSPLNWAKTESTISLLDNRFRVDPTIEQISFLIYRENPSKPVVLVRPDGKKYYVWDHPENVSWYKESSLDIISIDNPMPGPWQAVGKITPRNNIVLLSHLELKVENFPARTYHSERFKFTARLLQDGNPLVLQDFLDRVELKVSFTPFFENEDALPPDQKPQPTIVGAFMDNGQGLDEVAGDGVFTAEVPVDVVPGKYRTRIVSGNGVFLRTVEQTTLVYPSPVTLTFVQAREEGEDHKVMVTGEEGMVLPGSVAATVKLTNPNKKQIIIQSAVDRDSYSTEFVLPYDSTLGKHSWEGTVYATETASNRGLILHIPESSFSVMQKPDVEKMTAEYLRAQEEKKQALEQARLQREREEAVKEGMLMIIIGNIVVILLGLIIWFVVRKLRIRKVEVPEMQLDAPPKS